MTSERVAIVGAGAVGCYFGGMLARAGVLVTLIGRATHVDTINRLYGWKAILSHDHHTLQS